ncbi:MAG: zinc ribbon domain-containing protein, partial [Deltaproteobacteria bacterium]|nr:zinc ribbon domain-containing protein [Deltaproteobacteria bacterium]
LKCRDDFEQIVFGAQDQVKCPRCQSVRVRKKMSAFSFKSSGKPASSTPSRGCSGCSSHNCGTCH